MPKAKSKRKIKRSGKKEIIESEAAKEHIEIKNNNEVSDIGTGEDTKKETAPGDFQIVFSWETVDFIRKPITELYFIAAFAGAMIMIGWGIYNRSFAMVATFIVLVIVIILVLNEEPRKMKIKISEKGIDIDNDHYRFNEFRSFQISYIDEIPALILKQKKSFFPFRNIYIEDDSLGDIENFLEIYLENESEGKKEA